MKHLNWTRRTLLARACQLPATTLFVFTAGYTDKKQAAACADPAQLSDSDNSLRTSLQYTDLAADPAKACLGCAYFQSSGETVECGKCVILSGTVAATGRCMSWTAKK